nr:SMP-30/gluconolactonase/LRE family protein [Arthrobacter sp. H5]
MRAHQLTDSLCRHGEGPVWSDDWDGLRWVDMLDGDIMHLNPVSHAVSRRNIGDVAAAIRPRTGGGLVAAGERDFLLFSSVESGAETVLPAIPHLRLRFNDGGCDPSGAFLCGSMAYDESPGAGSLLRLEPDGQISTVLPAVSISNGLAFGPLNDSAFYVDTSTRQIDLFDWTSESGLHERRPFVKIDSELGAPDGLCVDEEGGVWVALWDGSAVHRYDARGALDAVIALPATRVTACTFGGVDLRELYITTSRYGLDAGSQPKAGALFVALPGIKGIPVLPFAG